MTRNGPDAAQWLALIWNERYRPSTVRLPAIRWSHYGLWERLLEQAQQREGLKLGMVFLDGTTIRAHQKAAGAVKKGDSSAHRHGAVDRG